VHFGGRYHVFFQWNPNACAHGAKSWGHASSLDLVDWTMHPPALQPGDWYDSHGCYSGSAWVMDGRLWLIYTGNVRDGEVRHSYQCLAMSDDGIHFTKLGPTLEQPPAGYTSHFRDPRLWRHWDGFHLVLGAQRNNGSGTVLHFHSPTLEQWTLRGELLPGSNNGYMCECPDLFTLQDRQLLLFCPQGQAGLTGPGPMPMPAATPAGHRTTLYLTVRKRWITARTSMPRKPCTACTGNASCGAGWDAGTARHTQRGRRLEPLPERTAPAELA
jgi:beta-fructofuranosidase